MDVSKRETSRVASLLQPWNMADMLVTWEVSKWETSRVARDLQSRNMPYIVVTLEVSSLETSQDDILLQPLNQYEHETGEIPPSTTTAVTMVEA